MTSFLERTKEDDGVFCLAPFVHMYIHGAERKKPCCVFEQYDLNTENTTLDLQEEWTSDYYKNIRQDILDGKKLKGCSRCYTVEEGGGFSDRKMYYNRYKNIIDETHVDLILNPTDGTQYGSPLDLDLRPSNLCNLSCRMCGPSSSSQLNKEIRKTLSSENETVIKLSRDFMIPFDEECQSNWLSDDNINFLLKNIRVGKNVKLLGGEPTIIPEVIQLMDRLVETGDSETVWIAMTTNLTNLNKKMLDTVAKLKYLHVNVSMDGIGKTLEYIRHPISWNALEKNIINVANIIHQDNIGISYTLQAYNMHNIFDTLEWVRNVNNSGMIGDRMITFAPEILRFPESFSYKNLPKSFRDKHIEKILNSDIMNEDFIKFQGKTLHRLELILNDPVELNPEKFLRHTLFFDKMRNQCMRDYLPELWDIFEDEYTKLEKTI